MKLTCPACGAALSADAAANDAEARQADPAMWILSFYLELTNGKPKEAQ